MPAMPAMLQKSYLVAREAVDMVEHRGPSTPMACDICAGIAGTQILKMLLKRGNLRVAPRGIQFDTYRGKLVKSWRPGGNANPLQIVAIKLARKLIANWSKKIALAKTARARFLRPLRGVDSTNHYLMRPMRASFCGWRNPLRSSHYPAALRYSAQGR